MPNRVIRDSVLESDRYLAVAGDHYRLAFLELLLLADDFGLVPLSWTFLRKRTSVFEGKTEAQVTHALQHLADHDLVRMYQSDSGALFGFIPRFGNNPRAKKPKWPLPPRSPAFKEINDLADSCTPFAPETETETETDLSTPSGVLPDGSPSCPHGLILKLWGEVMPELPQHKPAHWHETRRAHLRARWHDKALEKGWKSQADGLAYFRELLAYVRKSPFLMGQKPGQGGRPPFQITLEWLCNRTNFAKVVEGNYHRGEVLA